jgi:myo-inositol-hexaphosphate 3-phosphohydrolase
VSFTYLMAAAGGASSIITQVQQGGAAPLNTLADVGADETVNLDLRYDFPSHGKLHVRMLTASKRNALLPLSR